MNIFRHTWIQIYRGCLKSFATPSLQSKSKSKYLQFLFLTKEWHHPVSWNKKFKDIPLAGKVMATVLWDAQEVTSVSIMQWDQTTNSNRYSQTFKNCRTISAELDLTKMVLKSSFNMKTHKTHKFENTGNNHNTQMNCSSPPTTQPSSCPLRITPLWRLQRCHPREKVWDWWHGYWKS